MQFLGEGLMLRGWVLGEQGQVAEGLAQLRQGMADWGDTGAQIRPFALLLLAGAYGHMGQPEEELRVLAEAEVAAQARGEHFIEAELSRVKGELLLAQSTEHQATAATCFQQALTVARHQQAKSWELRAAMSLSRLWQRQGKRTEARELLAPLYGWFTEGFNTADLREAKALLMELS
jgi:predicted ATPase